jgi:hypothetical protein
MRRIFAVLLVVVAGLAAAGRAPLHGQTESGMNGVWTFNRSLSDVPKEVGFTADWMTPPSGSGQESGSNTSGRGRRGSGGGGSSRGSAAPFSTARESADDARRAQLLVAEVRTPPARLMVVDTPAAVTITNELGQSRVFHPDGHEATVEIQGTTVRVTPTRDGDRLVVLYHVEQGRDIRYTYSHTASPSQLVVDVQLLERGAGDKARFVYEPGIATEPRTSSPAASLPGSSSPLPAPEKFDERPGAELRGLKTLGILVEDFSREAVGCGLNHDATEAALAKRLTDGGFVVRKNSDEDTYVYVNVMTTRLSTDACVSRFDAFLYTHATANLTYRDRPVLVQVSLMHRGGMGNSAPASHAAAVTRGLEGFVDLFMEQIRAANK